MPPLTGLTILIAKHVEPLVFVGVMREIHRLQTPPGELDQILPERRLADDALNLEAFLLTGQPQGGDQKTILL